MWKDRAAKSLRPLIHSHLCVPPTRQILTFLFSAPCPGLAPIIVSFSVISLFLNWVKVPRCTLIPLWMHWIFFPDMVKLLSSSLSYCEGILLLGWAIFLPDYCKGNVIWSCLQYYILTNLLNLHKIASTQTFGPSSLIVYSKYLAKSHKLQVFNADGILKPGLGESLASLSVWSDTPKDYLRSPNSCHSRPSRLRMLLSSCMFNLLRRTK